MEQVNAMTVLVVLAKTLLCEGGRLTLSFRHTLSVGLTRILWNVFEDVSVPTHPLGQMKCYNTLRLKEVLRDERKRIRIVQIEEVEIGIPKQANHKMIVLWLA